MLDLQAYEHYFREEVKEHPNVRTLVEAGTLQKLLIGTLARMLCTWPCMTETVSVYFCSTISTISTLNLTSL
jgi:hypothetical protein